MIYFLLAGNFIFLLALLFCVYYIFRVVRFIKGVAKDFERANIEGEDPGFGDENNAI